MPDIPLVALGTPVVSARNWAEFLVPRNAGGWIWGIQLYNYPDANPTEWVIMHVEDGAYHIDEDQLWTPGDRGRYVSSSNLHLIKHQQRAPNGRIIYPVISMYWWYYDPNTEVMQQMPQVNTGGTNGGFYSVAFNHTGDKLYSGSIATINSPNMCPSVVEFDPIATPPTATNMCRVGSTNHTQPAYAYYLWSDGDWLYVLVGQDVWDCVAVQISTKTPYILSTLGAGSWAFFKEIVGQGLTVQMISNYNTPSQSINQFWVYNGATYPYTVGVPPPFPAHDVSIYENPIAPLSPPQIDSTPSPEAMLWRPNGSTGAWTENDYAINHAAPVDLAALYTLPSNQILGATDQYLGWFRYDPPSNETTFYGAWNQIAEMVFVPEAVDNKIYFSGYPNGVLFEYDPNAAWNVVTGTPNQNPKKLGNYSNGVTLSGVKRSKVLRYSSTYNRIYMVGQRDRSGDGGGIGYYDRTTKAFAGTFANLTTYTDKMGLAVFDNLDRYILAGKVTTGVAQLVLYDHNLVEIERQTPLPGSTDTGRLYRTNEAQIVVGVSATDKKVYRWNVVTKVLDGTLDLSGYGTGVVGPAQTQKADGTLVLVVGNHFLNVDPVTLVVTDLGTLANPALTTMASSGEDYFTSIGPDFYQIEGSSPTSYELDCLPSGIQITGHDANLNVGVPNVLECLPSSIAITGRPAILNINSPITLAPSQILISGRPLQMLPRSSPQVSENVVRLTGVVLGPDESYVVGLLGNRSVAPPDILIVAPEWLPYGAPWGEVGFKQAAVVTVNAASDAGAAVPIIVKKSGNKRSNFKITLKNVGIGVSPELEVYIRWT